MRHHIFGFVLIVLIILLFGCTDNSIKNPEQIGKQVFKILKNFDMGKECFIENFISIEEIHQLATNTEVVKQEGTRKDMAAMVKKNWIGRLANKYERIEKNGKKHKIDWQTIEYSDFIYKIKNDEGIRGCKGELYFKSQGQSYEIQVSSIYNGKEYKLVKIERIKKQK